MLGHTLSLVGIIAAGSIFAATASMQAGGKQPAAAPTAPPPIVAAAENPLASVAFLAGRWLHVDGEGATEEHWSAPRGGAMMGMFRWDQPDGSPVMFEILTITSEGADTVLRLRHYSPKLVAKEDKDKAMTLKLAEHGPRKVVFAAAENGGMLSKIVYHCPTADELNISVQFAPGENGEAREPLEFVLRREAK
jgi:hypothetical protein